MNTKKLTTKLGLSLPLLFLLALLPIPRAVAHDLKLIYEGDVINQILVFLPLIIWITVVIWKKVPKPFLTLLCVGLIYGLLLAITHQIAWDGFWNDNVPKLGGNAAGQISPATEAMVLRTATFIGSIITGVIVGAIAIGVQFIQRTFGNKNQAI